MGNFDQYMKGKTQGMLQALILKDEKKDGGQGVTQGCISQWKKNGVPRIRREQMQRISKKAMTVEALEREWKRKQKQRKKA